jgi:hypothetical protein
VVTPLRVTGNVITDYLAPPLIILAPISVVGDDGATKGVGVAYASLDWSTLLADTVPSFVGEVNLLKTLPLYYNGY